MKQPNALSPASPSKPISLKNIQRMFFSTQLVLILSLALILGIAGTLINIYFETEKRDQNLQNIAETIARSPVLVENESMTEENNRVLCEYLDSLKETLDNIDVISVVSNDRTRLYHSNHELIHTRYNGNLPEFTNQSNGYYTVDETGPSGNQRRAYAAIYDDHGESVGFVMAIMLMEKIQTENRQLFLIFLLITIVAIVIELFLSNELSRKVKRSLLGYEPDVFTAMYKMRDNILETLEEGILAVDENGILQFANDSALRMLCAAPNTPCTGQPIASLGDPILTHTMTCSEKELNISLSNADILLDRVPIRENDRVIGAIAVLHNRAEYTKLMEDLSGTRYLVDSMRANNHDFTNKLHVILGLIQMEMYEEATSYIQNITLVQRETISKVMHAVSDPAVAALLIGKIARASELNIKFILREDCYYAAADMNLPSEMLITVIGNLLDNAFEAMNADRNYQAQKELLLGLYSHPGALLITVDDTGSGITPEDLPFVFDNGFSTKGEGRGTGLYQVKSMVENFDGKITVESQLGVGTSFSVSFTKDHSQEA